VRDEYGRKFGGIKPGSRSKTMELRCLKVYEDASWGKSDLAYSDEMNAKLGGRLWNWKALVRSQS